MWDYLIRFFQEGGNWMYAELIILVVVISIIIERLYLIRVKHSLNSRVFIRKIKNFILDDNIKEAIHYCRGIPKALPQVILSLLENSHESEKKVQEAMETRALEIIPVLEKRTPYLAMLANIAMLTGLLGTVTGLIDSFKAVANADPTQKATLLAHGISIAMNTTMGGLVIAITTMIFYSYIQAGTKKIINDLELYSLQVFSLIREKKVKKNPPPGEIE